MDFSDDLGMAELLAIIAAVAVAGYLIWKYFQSATCILKVGAIPGVTGATEGQVQAAADAAQVLQPGGYTLWSCGSDFDFLQPCAQIVTEARHNWLDYIPLLNIGQKPVKYTNVPVSCYDFCKPGICASAAARATGN